MTRRPSQKTLARRSINFVVMYDENCASFAPVHINDLPHEMDIFAGFPTYKQAFLYANACNNVSSEFYQEKKS